MIETIVDRIYEAAIQPEAWPSILEDICAASGSASACLMHFSAQAPPAFVASERTIGTVSAFCSSGEWRDCARSPHAFSHYVGDFVCDADHLTPEQLENDAVAVRLKDLGLGWQQGTPFGLTPGYGFCFSVERNAADGRHDPAAIMRLSGLVPHLDRVASILAALKFKHARSTVDVLSTVGHASAVLDASGRVLACSRSFEALPGIAISPLSGRIRLLNAPSDAMLQDAINKQKQSLEGRMPCQGASAIPVPAFLDASALVLNVMPLWRTASDILDHGSILVVALLADKPAHQPAPTVLGALYGLSPVEARLCSHLAGGLNLRDAALKTGIKFSTARSYLEKIFKKTKTNSQVQLVLLLQLK